MIATFLKSTDSEIEGLLADPDSIEDLLFEDTPAGVELECDIDKAWHGLHFLLCGKAGRGEPPLDFILAGGKPVGDVDVGYGPARVLTSAELGAIVEALEAISPAELAARFDAAALASNGIYPDTWDEPGVLTEYLLPYYVKLSSFLASAHEEGRAMIVYLS
ncbi:MAG: YfbM family protein [Planctomycetota bacterium]